MINYILIFLLLFVGLVPIIREIFKGRFDFCDAKNPFIIYYIVQLGIAGFITLRTKNYSYAALDPVIYEDEYTKALLISTVGLIMFQIGYYLQGKRSLRLPKFLRVEWKVERILPLIIMYFVIAAISFTAFVNFNGGINAFFENREAWRAGGMIGQGFLIFPSRNLPVIASLMYFIYAANHYAHLQNRLWLFISVCLLILSSIPAMIMGFRSPFIFAIIQYIVLWHLCYKKIKTKNLMLMSIIIMLLFTIYGIIREVPYGVRIDVPALTETLIEKPELAYGLVSRSKGTEVVASVIHKLAETKEYELGWHSIIETLTIPIPKIIWESKPQPMSMTFTTYFFGDALRLQRESDNVVWGGVSPTIVGELYWHFSWIGVLFVLYILGKLMRIAYITTLHNINNKSVLIIYAILYPSFLVSAEALQGPLNGLMINAIVIFFTITMLTIKITSPQKLKIEAGGFLS